MWGEIFQQPLIRRFSISPPNLYIYMYYNYETTYIKINFTLLYLLTIYSFLFKQNAPSLSYFLLILK